MSNDWNRRGVLKAGVAVGSATALGVMAPDSAAAPAPRSAKPPEGFRPLSRRGRVVRVSARGSAKSVMQPNELWPKPEAAARMLEKSLVQLTGGSDLVTSLGKLIHPADTVTIKVNGIAGQHGYTMATNFELIAPLVEGLIALGVPAQKITVLEQRKRYLEGTRVNVRKWQLPSGVKTAVHENSDVSTAAVKAYRSTPTRYVTQVTEATAIINIAQIKDHSIFGYTGCIKNLSHGVIDNPSRHHDGSSSQPAALYGHSVLRSRVRLHLVDGFKIVYDGGPHDNPSARELHGAVYAGTDPVALDRVGLDVVEEARKRNKLPSLKRVGRDPEYLRAAARMGLGEYSSKRIRLVKTHA